MLIDRNHRSTPEKCLRRHYNRYSIFNGGIVVDCFLIIIARNYGIHIKIERFSSKLKPFLQQVR